MDETFTLPSYISGLIYDPVQVPPVPRLKIELIWQRLYSDSVDGISSPLLRTDLLTLLPHLFYTTSESTSCMNYSSTLTFI